MRPDPVPFAFAAWMEAHKRHIEAERRLAVAVRTSLQIGTTPPQDLADEVKALSAESDRLLRLAEAALAASVGTREIQEITADTEVRLRESERVLDKAIRGAHAAHYQSERAKQAMSEARKSMRKSN